MNRSSRQAPATSTRSIFSVWFARSRGNVTKPSAWWEGRGKQQPKSADAHCTLGDALRQGKRLEESIASYRRAIGIRPDFAQAHINMGIALAEARRHQDAVASYRRGLEIEPNNADAHVRLGNALSNLKRNEEAVACYRRARAIRPDSPFALGALAFAQRRICDWNDVSGNERELRERTLRGQSVTGPFAFLPFSDDPAEQLQCARVNVQGRFGSGLEPVLRHARPAGDRIRLAYLSADFREHATAYLTAGLFERHDRERFEVFAVSFGRDDRSAMRARLVDGFDHFIDVRGMGDADVARRISELGIDIAVDLMGYTKESRPSILGRRPAPVQVNYLGCPATMGADFVDYIFVDPFVVPADQQPFFTEKLVHLPDCYQVNDSRRVMSDQSPARVECGLPAEGFVFCSFNNSYKITPAFFDVWMRLLASVPGSVLWLVRDCEATESNLRREAEARGVDPERLVFASRVEYPKYLAHYGLAHLFLYTFPYNAGATAADALWAGLPVLTCSGRTFVGRMAGSLLHAVCLPELVTHCLEDYEVLALNLATDPERLGVLRARLG